VRLLFCRKGLELASPKGKTFVIKAMGHKVLILDDEQDLLDTYRELLSTLPSKPDVHTATSGARALALLESEPFSLLLTDLNMPGMDGFQVLTIVRRRFPSLRTVVMTSVPDEQYRARAYAMGIDLFMEKPKNEKDIALFSDCVESLLGREEQGGFRGVQSKSLVDLIQMECLSQSSSVLKITNGPLIGRIWIENGDVIDAEVGEHAGEDGFKQIVAWRSGTFEILPPDPTRARRIMTSYSGLLLDSAQSIDEGSAAPVETAEGGAEAGRLSKMARIKGVEFIAVVNSEDPKKFETWGLENPQTIADWTHQTAKSVRELAQKLNFGTFNELVALGPNHHLGMATNPTEDLCVGLNRTLTQSNCHKTLKEAAAQWVS
jgi:CheY-like chemotaxis protein